MDPPLGCRLCISKCTSIFKGSDLIQAFQRVGNGSWTQTCFKTRDSVYHTTRHLKTLPGRMIWLTCSPSFLWFHARRSSRFCATTRTITPYKKTKSQTIPYTTAEQRVAARIAARCKPSSLMQHSTELELATASAATQCLAPASGKALGMVVFSSQKPKHSAFSTPYMKNLEIMQPARPRLCSWHTSSHSSFHVMLDFMFPLMLHDRDFSPNLLKPIPV